MTHVAESPGVVRIPGDVAATFEHELDLASTPTTGSTAVDNTLLTNESVGQEALVHNLLEFVAMWERRLAELAEQVTALRREGGAALGRYEQTDGDQARAFVTLGRDRSAAISSSK